MKRNLIVLGGVALLVVTSLFIPIASFTQKAFYMCEPTVHRLH
jgi:hypothetical protein